MKTKGSGVQTPKASTHPAAMAARDFEQLGLMEVAYVKAVAADNGGRAFSVRAANGQEIAVAASPELATAFLIHNDLEQVPLH